MKRISFATLALLSYFLAGPADAQFRQPPAPPWAPVQTVYVADKYYESMGEGLSAARVNGKFIAMPKECMVRNVGGNCGYCAVEDCARYIGYTNLRGFSVGKGGCTDSSMARDLDRAGMSGKYKIVSGRDAVAQMIEEWLANDCPIAFTIPGHVIVCCGHTNTPDLGERYWIVDNSGPEKCEIKGWSKDEFERRRSGWCCGLFPIFPGHRPWHPGPGPGPAQPHVDPTPTLLQPPQAPTSDLADKIKDLDSRLKALEKGDATAPGHNTLADKVKALEAQHPILAASVEGLKAKLPDLVSQLAALNAQQGGVSGVLADVQSKLPGLIDKAKADGLINDAVAKNLSDKVVPFAGKVVDLEKKIDPIISAVPWGTILGSIGAIGGGGGFAVLLPLVLSALSKAKAAGTVLPALAGPVSVASPASPDPMALINLVLSHVLPKPGVPAVPQAPPAA